MQHAIFSRNTNPRYASWCLRLGLAFVFAYAAVDSLVHPNDWIGYMPHALDSLMSRNTLLAAVSVYQLVLAGWLVIGKGTRLVALLCTLTLGAITITNLGVFLITFRDVGLVLAALALFFV